MENNVLLTQFKPFINQNWTDQNFVSFTSVQEQAIPTIVEGSDVIVESPTGTGKTLAYLLPLLDKIEQNSSQIQTLVLAPTRELVMQIHQEINKFTKGSLIRSAAFIGGADIKRQMEKLKKHPQIVVGTPGRILELVEANKMKLHGTKSIVIDEADQMLQLGFIDTVKAVIKKTLRERQLLFFSATIPTRVEELGFEMMKEPKVIRIETQAAKSSIVEHYYIVSDQRDKIDVLRRIANLKDLKKAIIFVAETKKFEELVSKLRFKGLSLEYLHGESKKVEREQVIRKFRENRVPMLLTTDVSSRGLDFQNVSHVIHFDLPEEIEKYVHRSGRTGRMGKSGVVISIVTERETGRIKSFANNLGINISEKILYGGELSNNDLKSNKDTTVSINKKNKSNFERGNNFRGKIK